MTARFGLSTLSSALLIAACGNFFGEGPDPSRAGRFMSGGSAGSAGNSSGGTGGYCRQQGPLQDVLSLNGPSCTDRASCVQSQCSEAISCLGADIRGLDFNRSVCPEFMNCIVACQCDSECVSGCAPDPGPQSCLNCLGSLFSCSQALCSGGPSCGEGGSGGGGFGPVILVSNLNTNVNDLAVDDTHVYFATQQGLAKVSKSSQGSTAIPLGSFPNTTALAIRGEFIYVVEDSGEVTRLKTDGTDAQAIVPASFGGGSGPIVLDQTDIFYIVGQNLRRAPLDGGTATELEMNLWTQGGPPTPRRLAVDTASVYYVGGMGSAQLRMLDKTAASGPGTPLYTTSGDIRALVATGGEVFFAELGSDGLTTKLHIKALSPSADAGLATAIATHEPPDGNNFGTLGVGFTTDGTNIYFGGSPGIFSVSLTDPDHTLQTLDAYARPGAIEVDGEFLYYAEQMANTSIRRIPKN